MAFTGPPAVRARPCGGPEPCPWRRDAPPGQFPADAFRHSAATSRPGADRDFGCHASRPEQPQMCAGWLLRGARHHAGAQRQLADGTLARPVLPAGMALYDSYAAMAVANGVAPDDPALTGPAPDCVSLSGGQPQEDPR